VFHRSGEKVFILGAGDSIKGDLDDFSWMGAWAAYAEDGGIGGIS
jgi:hypothetical protein